MEYVGIATQQSRNNRKSIMLLAGFPLILFALLYIGCLLYYTPESNVSAEKFSLATIFLSLFPRLLIITIVWFIIGYLVNVHITTLAVAIVLSYVGCAVLIFIKSNHNVYLHANELFFTLFPYVAIGTLIWFIVAYFANVYIIDKATDAYALERNENKRVYNLVENLCISCGMTMPKIHVIETSSLNAFASGVSSTSYAITLTRGIIDALDDKELEGVIAHELTHIRNNDVRLLIISIVFVGFFDLIAECSTRVLRGRKRGGAGILWIIAIVVVLAIVGYGISILMRFAISQDREYVADAGAAELTKDPKSLANALRKISGNSALLEMQHESVAQLFIENKSEKRFFATHPPIERRIAILEQF